jgi:membrane protein
MTLIVKRFVAEEGPYTSEDLSKETKIPIKIVRNSINTLVDVGLVVGVHNDDSRQKSYYPAVDVNNITIGKLISRIDNYGSDSLKLEENEKLAPFWHRLEALRKDPESRKVLLKDI